MLFRSGDPVAVAQNGTFNSNPVCAAAAIATLELVADPDLTVVKTADRDSVSLVGEVITYTIGVTNTGNVTLTGRSGKPEAITKVTLFDVVEPEAPLPGEGNGVRLRRRGDARSIDVVLALADLVPQRARVDFVEAGRLAYLAGRMPKKLYASASSPLSGVVR